LQNHVVISSLPLLPEGGELPEETTLDDVIPENSARKDGEEIEETVERTDSTSRSPPSASSNGAEEWRKRKRVVEDFESLGTSISTDEPQTEATTPR
jgi:hypothetical protein